MRPQRRIYLYQFCAWLICNNVCIITTSPRVLQGMSDKLCMHYFIRPFTARFLSDSLVLEMTVAFEAALYWGTFACHLMHRHRCR